jgi:hypothetical protein
MSFLAVPATSFKTRLSPANSPASTEVIPPLLRKEKYKSATISVVGSRARSVSSAYEAQ